MRNKEVVVTPTVKTIWKTNLHQPDVKTAEKFPRMSTTKDGQIINRNLKYKLNVVLDLNNTEHSKFFDDIQLKLADLRKTVPAETKVIGPRVRPKKVKNRDTGELHDAPGFTVLGLESAFKVPVYENDLRLGSAKEILNTDTEVKVELEISTYDFVTETGDHLVGLKLTPIRVDVLGRPPVKSFIKR